MPAICSGELQPLDLSVNKPVKNFLRAIFQDWYAAETLGSNTDAESASTLEPIKFPMSQVKPLGAQWLFQMYKHIITHPEIMKNGPKAAGNVDELNKSSL